MCIIIAGVKFFLQTNKRVGNGAQKRIWTKAPIPNGQKWCKAKKIIEIAQATRTFIFSFKAVIKNPLKMSSSAIGMINTLAKREIKISNKLKEYFISHSGIPSFLNIIDTHGHIKIAIKKNKIAQPISLNLKLRKPMSLKPYLYFRSTK
jgi:hypothetical protein